MDKKPLRERLLRYKGVPGDSSFFNNVTDYDILTDKENRGLLIEAQLSATVGKELIGAIELKLKEDYELNGVQIKTRYPAKLFNADYVQNLMAECGRRGKIVVKGFFCKSKIQNHG